MKGICIDARMLSSTGIGAYLDNLLKFLPSAPFRFHALIHPHHINQFNHWGKIEPILIDTPIYSIREQLLYPFKIPRCDLFWSPHYNIPLLPIPARKRITTIHDAYHLAFFQTLSPFQKIYAKVVMRAAVKYAAKVITDSQFSKSELQRFTAVEEKNVSVIPLGVNRAVFRADPSPGDGEFLKRHRLPKQYVLFVGSLKPHKNLKGLFEAFRLLEQEGIRDLGLVVIGKREGFKTGENLAVLLQRYPELLHRIHFLDELPEKELASAYRLAQALVLPSFYEGFGLPPIEAMSSGCPTIVSNCASLPEVCKEAAFYINPHSPYEIAAAIKRLIQDQRLRETLRRSGMARSENFSWKRCAEKHLELMEEVVNS
ncbi:MAG: glycosyltransferase family 4 protein [Verrucomicrobia bacterium]|nr:glycosyltransferase family 4 protein [Verrucomicrobiota bacterium]